MSKPKTAARRTPPAVTLAPPGAVELTMRAPGLEAILADVVKFAVAKAEAEASREDRMTGDDALAVERLRLERERLDLSRAELAQREREWALEAEERRLRLEERKLELAARAARAARGFEGADHE